MLRETNISIDAIAKQSGYVDSSYFARIVKRRTGMGPREFRKHYG